MIVGTNLYNIVYAFTIIWFLTSKFLCMVLQDGKHIDLIEKGGLYSRLAKRQNDDLK